MLPGNDLRYPDDTKELHHEVELVVALGREGFKIQKTQSKDLIFGYAVGVDLTKRDLQKNAKETGRPWMSGKVFSGSAAISDIVIKEESEKSENIELSLIINDIIRQQSKCAQMIWSVEEIIFLLSQTIPLFTGDLIYTGTPSGVRKIKKGDTVSATLHQKNSVYLSFDIL